MKPCKVDLFPIIEEIEQAKHALADCPRAAVKYGDGLERIGDHISTAAENFFDLYTRRDEYDDRSGKLRIFYDGGETKYEADALEFYNKMWQIYNEEIQEDSYYNDTISELRFIEYSGCDVDLAEADLRCSGMGLVASVMYLASFAVNLIPGLTTGLQIELGGSKTSLFGKNIAKMVSACEQISDIIVEQGAQAHQSQKVVECARTVANQIWGLNSVYREHIEYVSQLYEDDGESIV
jgi:hypothetical protein